MRRQGHVGPRVRRGASVATAGETEATVLLDPLGGPRDATDVVSTPVEIEGPSRGADREATIRRGQFDPIAHESGQPPRLGGRRDRDEVVARRLGAEQARGEIQCQDGGVESWAVLLEVGPELRRGALRWARSAMATRSSRLPPRARRIPHESSRTAAAGSRRRRDPRPRLRAGAARDRPRRARRQALRRPSWHGPTGRRRPDDSARSPEPLCPEPSTTIRARCGRLRTTLRPR